MTSHKDATVAEAVTKKTQCGAILEFVRADNSKNFVIVQGEYEEIRVYTYFPPGSPVT